MPETALAPAPVTCSCWPRCETAHCSTCHEPTPVCELGATDPRCTPCWERRLGEGLVGDDRRPAEAE